MICNKCGESINHSMDYCPFCGHKNTFVRPNIILEKKISQVKEFFKGDSYRDCYKLFSLLLSRKTVQTNTETVTDIVYDTSADKIIDGKTIYKKMKEMRIEPNPLLSMESFQPATALKHAFICMKHLNKRILSTSTRNSLVSFRKIHCGKY